MESLPTKAKVYIDSKYVGRTPLSKPLNGKSGFIKLEIKGPNGYKTHQQVIDLTEDDLNLTNENTVKLFKDKLREANIAFKNKKFNRYLSVLGSISKRSP